MKETSQKWIFVNHIGAGHHSRDKKKLYFRIMESSCRVFSLSMTNENEDNNSHLEKATSEGVSVLEDSPETNAGFGSNLTRFGHVECESMIASSNGRSGSVRAASLVRNPIKLSYCLSLNKFSEPRHLGLIEPNHMSGVGCYYYAKEHYPNLVVADSESDISDFLVTEESLKRFNEIKYQNESKNVNLEKQYDTIGSIGYFDHEIVVSSSSGGILYKYPGRVGSSSVFGAGCYVPQIEKEDHEIGITCSGTGEILTNLEISRKCCDLIIRKNMDIDEAIKVCVDLVSSKDGKIGILVLQKMGKNVFMLGYGYNTSSFAFGYFSSFMKTPKSVISYKNDNDDVLSNNSKESVVGVISIKI